MIGQLGIIILSFADTMMVGRCGTAELGAASFVNNMFNLVIVFSTGFSYGLTPFVGNHYGRGENASVGRILKNALAVNAVVAAGLMALMFILYLNIHRLGQPAELLPLMRPYYIVLLISLLFVLLFNAFKQFADGITDTVTPMVILLGGNVVNIFLNWILIYGKWGMPRMGLLGAGVATLTARVLMLLCFVVVFFVAKRYRPYVQGFKEAAVNRKDFAALNKMGMPVGLQMGMETASFSLSTIMVGWLGTVALAAHQVMLTVGQLGFMMYYGMAAAVAVRASNFHGQGDMLRVKENVSAGFKIILVMAAAVSIPLLIVRNSLGYFFTDSAEVAAMVAQLVIPFVIYQFGDGLQCNYSNALRGISDVKMVMVYAFIAYFLISLPSAYLFGFVFDWGLTGIWMSFPLGLTSAGLLFWRRYRKSISMK
ncbi:MAG: MATE family efflux transporter [Bacteroidales bacterium]|nr:MATE family efflux transporter [Bacteroidales bacterium]